MYIHYLRERSAIVQKRYRIFIISLLLASFVTITKYMLHALELEVFAVTSLHATVLTGTFFVIGFLLSATISDYKESERIPSEFASVLENMHEDAVSVHRAYPTFDVVLFRRQLQKIAVSFAKDVRQKQHRTRHTIHDLNETFYAMEQASVPANFIVKLKQQQAQLLRVLFRVTYIQRITFIPSAGILANSIVPFAILIVVFTEIEPFYGGMAISALISFILIYVVFLIRVISVPFQAEGKTQDDVSLFLIDETARHLSK